MSAQVKNVEVIPDHPPEYWFERLGLKRGAALNEGVKAVFARVEAIELRLARLETARSDRSIMDK